MRDFSANIIFIILLYKNRDVLIIFFFFEFCNILTNWSIMPQHSGAYILTLDRLGLLLQL